MFVSDPQLRSEAARETAERALSSGGAAVMTGTLEAGSYSERLFRQGKMALLRYPVHLNRAQYRLLTQENDFARAVPYHSPAFSAPPPDALVLTGRGNPLPPDRRTRRSGPRSIQDTPCRTGTADGRPGPFCAQSSGRPPPSGPALFHCGPAGRSPPAPPPDRRRIRRVSQRAALPSVLWERRPDAPRAEKAARSP